MTTTKPRAKPRRNVDGENDKRADSAEQAVAHFQELTGTDDGDAVCDLLCNLMHLCHQQKKRYGAFADQLARGEGHFDAETGHAPY